MVVRIFSSVFCILGLHFFSAEALYFVIRLYTLHVGHWVSADSVSLSALQVDFVRSSRLHSNLDGMSCSLLPVQSVISVTYKLCGLICH